MRLCLPIYLLDQAAEEGDWGSAGKWSRFSADWLSQCCLAVVSASNNKAWVWASAPAWALIICTAGLHLATPPPVIYTESLPVKSDHPHGQQPAQRYLLQLRLRGYYCSLTADWLIVSTVQGIRTITAVWAVNVVLHLKSNHAWLNKRLKAHIINILQSFIAITRPVINNMLVRNA